MRGHVDRRVGRNCHISRRVRFQHCTGFRAGPCVPHVATSVPKYGFRQLWADSFLSLLSHGALTSSISLLEVIVAFFVEEKHISRRKATVISTVIVTIFGILCTLSFGPLKEVHIGNLSVFGIFDYVSSNILLPVGGILISIYVGWRFDRRLLEAELTNNGELKLWLLKPLIFVLKYVAPLFILVILLHSLGLF